MLVFKNLCCLLVVADGLSLTTGKASDSIVFAPWKTFRTWTITIDRRPMVFTEPMKGLHPQPSSPSPCLGSTLTSHLFSSNTLILTTAHAPAYGGRTAGKRGMDPDHLSSLCWSSSFRDFASLQASFLPASIWSLNIVPKGCEKREFFTSEMELL